eukprot:SAG22_NODE_11269_length_493_cov_0.619289_2_plen_81_part_00
MVTNLKADAEIAAYDPGSWPLQVQRQSIAKHLGTNAEAEIVEDRDQGQLAAIAKLAAAPGANIRHREKVKSIKAAKAKRS